MSEDAIDELARLLVQCGLKVTLDLGRSNQAPCTFCGRKPEPGAAHSLWSIGRYHNGEILSRPVCTRCAPLALAKGGKKHARLS